MLEVLGLLLAAIDITGLTPILERSLVHLKDTLVGASDRFKEGGPPKKYWTAGIITIILFSLPSLPLRDMFHIQSLGDVVLLVIGLVFVFGFLYFAAILIMLGVFLCFYYLFLYPLAALFYILALPRRGILASIGLLIAIAGCFQRSVH
jgi:hypothetical protein